MKEKEEFFAGGDEKSKWQSFDGFSPKKDLSYWAYKWASNNGPIYILQVVLGLC